MRLDTNSDTIAQIFTIELDPQYKESTYTMAKQKTQTAGVNPKALFEAYQSADDKVEAARAALDASMAERSSTVKVIKETLGDGPFQWRGKMMKPYKRDTKDEAGAVVGTTHFFRELGGELNVIE